MDRGYGLVDDMDLLNNDMDDDMTPTDDDRFLAAWFTRIRQCKGKRKCLKEAFKKKTS